eukprot:TRINITY_DN20317_c0_g2_i3.p2 TRINITY_DN20317_c0_g2~~TRINITY_DN20317_c0_g2_i3.p2  ORF type:complete len:159 (+),score=28.48 TRINITY_DN20317_c0_g2_i3:99-575(+)
MANNQLAFLLVLVFLGLAYGGGYGMHRNSHNKGYGSSYTHPSYSKHDDYNTYRPSYSKHDDDHNRPRYAKHNDDYSRPTYANHNDDDDNSYKKNDDHSYGRKDDDDMSGGAYGKKNHMRGGAYGRKDDDDMKGGAYGKDDDYGRPVKVNAYRPAYGKN